MKKENEERRRREIRKKIKKESGGRKEKERKEKIVGLSQCKIISAYKEPRHLATLKSVKLIW